MSPGDFYVKNVFYKFGYVANWFPNTQVNVGDMGIMDGYYFKKLSSLKELNLIVKVRNSEKPVDFSNDTRFGGPSQQPTIQQYTEDEIWEPIKI